MISKKGRTLDLYKRIGAEARIIKDLLSLFIVDGSKILYSTETDQLFTIAHKLDLLIARMDTRLFTDHPKVGHDYCNVFYGGLKKSRYSRPMDFEMIELAQKIIDERIGDIFDE